MKKTFILIFAMVLVVGCTKNESYNFRQVAINPHQLEGQDVRIVTTNNQVIEMTVEKVYGSHLYGQGKYVPISLIRSVNSSSWGVGNAFGAVRGASPVRMDEISSYTIAFIVLAFPAIIIIAVAL